MGRPQAASVGYLARAADLVPVLPARRHSSAKWLWIPARTEANLCRSFIGLNRIVVRSGHRPGRWHLARVVAGKLRPGHQRTSAADSIAGIIRPQAAPGPHCPGERLRRIWCRAYVAHCVGHHVAMCNAPFPVQTHEQLKVAAAL